MAARWSNDNDDDDERRTGEGLIWCGMRGKIGWFEDGCGRRRRYFAPYPGSEGHPESASQSISLPKCNGSLFDISTKNFGLNGGVRAVDVAKLRVLDAAQRVLVCDDFLAPAEAQSIIDATTPHLRSLSAVFPTEYRANDRALCRIPPEAADVIFSRVLSILSREDVFDRHPMCFGHGGVWAPLCVNRCVKVTRATPPQSDLAANAAASGHFARHRDAPWVQREDQASVFTVLIYLSDVSGDPLPSSTCHESCTPGATVIFPECDAKGCEVMKHPTLVGPELADPDRAAVLNTTMIEDPPDERDFANHTNADAAKAAEAQCAASHRRIAVAPRTGRVLLFPHHLPHSAAPLVAACSGAKFVLRTELVYRRVAPLIFAPRPGIAAAADPFLYAKNPEYIAARSLYEESQQQQLRGDTAEFVRLFHRVVDAQMKAMLQTPDATTMWPQPLLGSAKLTSTDVLEVVFNFLGPLEVARGIMACNHRLYFTAMRAGTFWRSAFEKVFPSLFASIEGVRGRNPDSSVDCAMGSLPAASLRFDDTIAWYDVFRRASIATSALRPLSIVVFTTCVAMTRLVVAKQKRAEAKQLLGDEVAQHARREATDLYAGDLECWLDIDGAAVHSRRLPEAGMSIYHFHISDDARFTGAFERGGYAGAVPSSAFPVARQRAVCPESGRVSWAAVGRAITTALDDSPAATRFRVPGSALHSPPPLLVVSHPLTCDVHETRGGKIVPTESARCIAREVFECAGASVVAVAHPALVVAAHSDAQLRSPSSLVIIVYEECRFEDDHYELQSANDACMSWIIPEWAVTAFACLVEKGDVTLAKEIVRDADLKPVVSAAIKAAGGSASAVNVLMTFSTCFGVSNVAPFSDSERDKDKIVKFAQNMKQNVATALGVQPTALHPVDFGAAVGSFGIGPVFSDLSILAC